MDLLFYIVSEISSLVSYYFPSSPTAKSKSFTEMEEEPTGFLKEVIEYEKGRKIMDPIIEIFDKRDEREMECLHQFNLAARNGKLDECKKLWHGDIRINPSVDGSLAFRDAARNGHLHVCKWLLSLSKEYGVDPAAYNNTALKEATKKVREWLLLLDPKYGVRDPTIKPPDKETDDGSTSKSGKDDA